ncbi:MAG: TRAP transporter large permease [Pseudoflavonifractor sp.]|nr:TRAP transporter large permease [Pseudoflavonifractor sp.]
MNSIVLAVVVILVLILLGMSVPWCFLCGSLIYVLTTGASTGSFVSTAFYSLESTSTLAIPLFMAAGVLLEKSGIARTLIDLAEKLMRRFKGGMGATIPVVACFFGALSGSGTATVTTLSSMMAPRLREMGWDKRYLAAFIAACGPLGYMIPPNMNAILYSNVSSASVSGLFLATVIPGLMWALLYLFINRLTYQNWYDPAKSGHLDPVTDTIIPMTEEEKVLMHQSARWSTVIKRAIPAFLMPVIIMGGIYSGIFTATEAGGVGCLYGVFVGLVIYRSLNAKSIFNAFVGTGSSLGSFLIMFPMTLIFSRIMVTNGVPDMITKLITGVSDNRFVILFILDIVLIIAGCFLDAGVLLLVLTPLLLPTAAAIGLTQIQLGVIMFVAVGVGTITPPMAMNIFITGKACNVSVREMMSPLLPFLLFGALPVLLLVTFVPELSLWLPRLVMGMVS